VVDRLDVVIADLEGRAGKDRHGHEAADRRAEEREDELVVLRADEGDGVVLREAGRREERRASMRFGSHRLVRKIELLPVRGDEPKAALLSAGKAIERFDQR
jgi:hypothetical protein